MEVVIGKRQLSDLVRRVNDHATRGGITGFAKRFMEKHGWKEGQGLGKNKDGMTEHIKIKQREDNAGLGIEEHERKSVTENWWFGSFEQALSSFKNIGATDDGGKKAKKRRKSKTKETKSEVVASTMWGSADSGIEVPSYEELFKATGGKRLGMRARASQKGKWARTEHMTQVTSSADGSIVTTTSTAQEAEYSTGSTQASASSSALASVAATMVESDTSSDKVVPFVQAATCGGKKRKKDKQERSRGCEEMEGDGVAVAGGEDAGCGTVAVEALQEDGDDGVACSGLEGAEMKREKRRRKKERKSREVEVEQEAVVAVHEEEDSGEDDDVKPEKRKSKKKRKRRQETEE